MRRSDEDQLDDVFDVVDAGLAVLDDQRRVVAWNAWIASASGIAPDDARGRRFDELFPEADLKRLDAAACSALDSGASSLLTQSLHGAILPLRTRFDRLLAHNIAVRPLGERPHARCLVQVMDVTAATDRERVLRQRLNARYDAVVENAPDPILTLDCDGVIQTANPAAAREFGFEPGDLIGQPFQRLTGEAQAWSSAWDAVLEGLDVRWPVELAIQRKDGSTSWIDASASRWFSGSRPFVAAVLRNVNDRRAAETALLNLNETLEERVVERTADLERAHEQLRQSQKMEAVGQLTGGIAHDFNNLLTPIIGGLDVLKNRGAADARAQRLIEGALQAAERARVLVQRLLAFARRQPLQTQPLDMEQVVIGISELIGGTLGPQIRIMLNIAENLPPAMADLNQVEMALLNLAVNARDAMADGGILTISLAASEIARDDKLKPGRYVRLAVSDTGVGMDARTLSRAIEPFFSTKGIGKGTGLGLSMIHGLVSQLGGCLELFSTPGVGTTAEIWLPAADQAEAPVVQTAPGEAVDGRSRRVLLVDDEELIRSTTAQMLVDLGYTVIEADSGKAALRHLSDPRIDLIVTDHLMPGMTGTELAREARALRADFPILVVSGFADVDDIATDLRRLMKPFRQAELAAALAGLAALAAARNSDLNSQSGTGIRTE